MPSMNFDAGASAWTGGQYIGPCIPGMGTADLATALETSETGAGGNYVYSLVSGYFFEKSAKALRVKQMQSFGAGTI